MKKQSAKKIVNKTKAAPKNKAITVKKEAPVSKVDNRKKEIKIVEKAQVPQTIKEKSEKKKDKLKVLYVTSEAAPFIRTGGLGDVAGSLPSALINKGVDARVILPLYEGIPTKYRQTMEYIGYVYVTLAWRYQYCGLFRMINNGVTYYFIDNEYYFKRSGIYGHFDDAERFAFFSRAVLEALPTLGFRPDVIHSNDWQSALVPVFLDVFYRGETFYKYIRTIFTIHNIEFQGKYNVGITKDILGLPDTAKDIVEYAGDVNYMKGGIEAASQVTTVSPTYAKEIFDPFYSHGLDSILSKRSYKISGIINGIDTGLYDPNSSSDIVKNYNYATFKNKEINKKELLKLMNLPYDENAATIGMVSRLTDQKGIDLVVGSLERIIQKNVRVVILGKGDWKYENALFALKSKYPGKINAVINFSADIASKIYAGSDIFLMPSKFEPCGISQLIAMRYGSIPIVRETGGLKDTVIAYNKSKKTGNGFTFYDYNCEELLGAVDRALELYADKKEWNIIVKNAMEGDYSWDKSALNYIKLYEKI